MKEIVQVLADQQSELSGLLAELDDEGWQRPSRCEGWTVSDVVVHLAQTNEMAIGSAQGRYEAALYELTDGLGAAASVDEGAALMVARDHDEPAAVLARWEAGAAELQRSLLARNPSDRVTWVAGELSARTLATTRLAETWIHTGDITAAFGIAPASTDRLWHIARLAWRTVPYAFARDERTLHGPVTFDLRGPHGEQWLFADDDALTTITGDALDLCLVAGQRTDAADTGLSGEGPDAAVVLELVRTYA